MRALALVVLLAAGPGLAETVAKAEREHPAAEAARAGLAAARAGVSSSRRGLWPRLSLSGRYSRQDAIDGDNKAFIDFGGGPVEVETGLGEISGSWNLVLNQPVWDFGLTRAAVNSARAGEETARLEAVGAANQAGLAAGEAWLDLWLAHEGLSVALAREETALLAEEDARRRENAGLATRLDVLRFEADTLAASERVLSAEAGVAGAEAMWESRVGDAAPDSLPLLGNPPALTDGGRRLSPDLAASRLRQAEKGVALTRSRPRLDLTADAAHPVNESGFATGDTITLTAVFSWPLWEPVTDADRRAASLRSEAAARTLDDAVATEEALVAASMAQLATYPPRLETARARVRLAEEAASVAEAGRQAGTISYLEWSAAEDDLVEARLAAADILASWWREALRLLSGGVSPISESVAGGRG